MSSIRFNLSVLLENLKGFKTPLCFYVCFFKAFPKGEYEKYTNLVCVRLESNISLSVRHSYLSIFPYDRPDSLSASLLISYCSFSSLILSSVVMISFYILFKRFFLKHKGLSDVRVV